MRCFHPQRRLMNSRGGALGSRAKALVWKFELPARRARADILMIYCRADVSVIFLWVLFIDLCTTLKR